MNAELNFDSLVADCEAIVASPAKKSHKRGRRTTPGMEARRAARKELRRFADLYLSQEFGHTEDESAEFDVLRRKYDALSTGNLTKSARQYNENCKQPMEVLGNVDPIDSPDVINGVFCPPLPSGQNCADFAAYRSAYLRGTLIPVEGISDCPDCPPDPLPSVKCYDSLANYRRVKAQRDFPGYSTWFSDANKIGETYVPDCVIAPEGEYISVIGSSRPFNPLPAFLPATRELCDCEGVKSRSPSPFYPVVFWNRPILGTDEMVECCAPVSAAREVEGFNANRFSPSCFDDLLFRSPSAIANLCRKGKKTIVSPRVTETRKVFRTKGGAKIRAKTVDTLCGKVAPPCPIPVSPTSTYVFCNGVAYRTRNREYVLSPAKYEFRTMPVSAAVVILRASGYSDDEIRAAFAAK